MLQNLIAPYEIDIFPAFIPRKKGEFALVELSRFHPIIGQIKLSSKNLNPYQ